MTSEVLYGFSKHAFSEKLAVILKDYKFGVSSVNYSDSENLPFSHFSIKLSTYCDQLMPNN